MRLSILFAAVAFCLHPAIGQRTYPFRDASKALAGLRSENQQGVKPAPWPPQLEMRVPFEPTAFPSGPHFYVMYELHLTNFGITPLSLSRIEVLDADAGAAQPIATFEAEQL